jgi:outer membrane protein OmpA-like peptidoglycan-associated protein
MRYTRCCLFYLIVGISFCTTFAPLHESTTAGTLEEEDYYTLGIGITPVVLFGDAKTHSDLGLGIEALFERRMGASWAIRGTTGLFAVEGQPGRLKAGMPQDLDFSTQVFALEVTPRLRWGSLGKTEEYLFIGVGAVYRSSLADSFISYSPDARLSSSGWEGALSGGVGVRWSLSPRWDSEFAVGVRYYTTDALDNIEDSSPNDLTVHFGITFLRSVAPITRQRLTSRVLRDTDGDGIPDWYDLKIYDPEDYDGFQDEDGAPDPDNDGDGIPDIRDKAPNEPETFNGYMDDDGAPDELPPPSPESSAIEKSTQTGKRRAAWEVYFGRGLDKLTRSSVSVLDRVAKVMRDDAKTHMEIHGYADPQGDAKANLVLSRKRAEAVRNHLIRKGASASNLKVIAHGEVKRSLREKGRSHAKQRRVVIVQVK